MAESYRATRRTGPSRPEIACTGVPRPGKPRPGGVARTSISRSFEPAFNALVTSQRYGCQAWAFEFLPVQLHARVVVHIGDFQKHPLARRARRQP